VQARRQHSGVEACINNFEVRGLNRCLSYGQDGFERHVALSIVATNLHRIGLLLQRKELARLHRTARPQLDVWVCALQVSRHVGLAYFNY